LSTATWLDPVVTKPDVFYSLQFMRGDDTDDTTGFQAMLAAVRANGGGHIVMQKPRARYRFVSTGQGYPGQDFPSNTEMYGEPGTEVYWTGAPKQDDFAMKARSQDHGWLEIAHGSSNILIRDLVVRSDNTPFTSYFNNQSSGIYVNVATPASHDVMIRDCGFLNHVGFPVHAPGGGNRVHTIRNVYRNCANGENNNGDYSVHFRNRFINSEGLEASGAFNIFALNDFSQSFTKGAIMSLGGDISSGTRRIGSLAVGNSIKNAPGLGILTADAFASGWLQGNRIEGAGNSAIQIGGATHALCDHNAVVDNICVSAKYGINVFSMLATDTLVATNSCTDDFVGFLCSSARATVIGNTFSGTFKDVAFNVADGALFTRNSYSGARFEVRGSAAFSRAASPAGVEIAFLGRIDQGMVTIQIRNWSSLSSVALDFDGILQVGEQFALYHPYHVLDAPIMKATYTGKRIDLPLRRIAAPPDWPVSTSHSIPELGTTFAAFILTAQR